MSPGKSRRPRGMVDLFGDVWRKHRWVEDEARAVCSRYGFQPLETPLIEEVAVFQRSLGSASDVVSKEMFSVQGMASAAENEERQALALRPEGTAGACRFVAEQGGSSPLYQLFYSGPMFRYERPQRGRQRAFHQIGVEAIGGRNPTLIDAQVIECATEVLRAVGAPMSWVELRLNSLGNAESRRRHELVLRDYLAGHRSALSPDSQARFDRGSYLRILDSKDPGDAPIIAAAPSVLDSLSRNCADRFLRLQGHLRALAVANIVVDPRLVRGLDYYAHTVFEFVCSSDALGPQQATLLAGGRYQELVANLGGADIAGVGWAAGVERLLLVQPDGGAAAPAPFAVAVLLDTPKHDAEEIQSRTGEELANAGLQVCQRLRSQGLRVVFTPMGPLKRQLARALTPSQFAPDLPDVAVFLKPADGDPSVIRASVKTLKTHEEVLVPQLDLNLISDAVARARSALTQDL